MAVPECGIAGMVISPVSSTLPKSFPKRARGKKSLKQGSVSSVVSVLGDEHVDSRSFTSGGISSGTVATCDDVSSGFPASTAVCAAKPFVHCWRHHELLGFAH